MKHLPKHLRPRWRYLAVGLETVPGESITRRSFQRECWYAAQNLLGDPGSAAADLTVVAFEFSDRGEFDDSRGARGGEGGGTGNESGGGTEEGDEGRTGTTDGGGTGEALVRVRHGETDPARAALACIDSVDGLSVGIHVRGISGTIRAARDSFLDLA